MGRLAKASKQTGPMELDESQGDGARKGLDDLSVAFERGARNDVSPVKEKLAKVRKLIAETPDEVGTASSSSHATDRAVLDAIGALSQKMDNMAINMTTKSDLMEMKSEISQEIKVTVAQAVDPLKSDLHDLSTRVLSLEEAPSLADAPQKKPTNEANELQKMINDLDPALKQISFSGWPDSVAIEKRMDLMEKFVKEHAPGSRIVGSGIFYAGPYSDRKPTKAGYVELSSVDEAKRVLKSVKGCEFKTGNGNITVKAARTKLNSKRNSSLFKAVDAIKGLPENSDKNVHIDWKERCVKVVDDIAFVQKKGELNGSFLPPYTHLHSE